jgi:bifunctional non-homologous end joining protein LigD
MAEQLATAHPKLFAVARGATHRGRRVTVDHAQNSVGRNTAAPYTARALPGGPVSTPLTWEEVEAGRIRPADLTLRVVPERVRALGDLFAPVLQGGQRLQPG